jgi:hypothetical protein
VRDFCAFAVLQEDSRGRSSQPRDERDERAMGYFLPQGVTPVDVGANPISEDDARGKLEEIRFAHLKVGSTREQGWKLGKEIASLALICRTRHLCHA